jgi:hypothetical protein
MKGWLYVAKSYYRGAADLWLAAWLIWAVAYIVYRYG